MPTSALSPAEGLLPDQLWKVLMKSLNFVCACQEVDINDVLRLARESFLFISCEWGSWSVTRDPQFFTFCTRPMLVRNSQSFWITQNATERNLDFVSLVIGINSFTSFSFHSHDVPTSFDALVISLFTELVTLFTEDQISNIEETSLQNSEMQYHHIWKY